MASLNSVKIVLWSIWTHLLTPLLGAFSISILVGLVAFFLAKVRARRESAIQELKTQIDGLTEKLGSLHALAATVAIELGGLGPYELPLLTELDWLIPDGKDGVIAGFRSAEGKRIHASISYRAVAQVINDHRAAPLRTATLSSSTLVDLTKPADAHLLPGLPRLEGHCHRARNVVVMVFSSGDGRKILFPLTLETYEQLLIQSNAALASFQEEKRLHEIIPRHRSTPLFSGE